jgi:TolB-like protein/Tfp pilus assembly protein PilF
MIGQRLRQYRIDEILGRGGMGVVYRAEDERLRRNVAVKVLTGAAATDATTLLREARIASSLNHPGIAVIHEIGDADGVPYIVMEFVDGEPLSRLIPPGVGLPFDQTVRYGIQIADALAHAHGRGVVHRDLKSANVSVSHDGRVRVLDFGLALPVRQRASRESTDDHEAAQKPISGTLPYMAPEVLRGTVADVRSDIWGLGVVLYEMATGEQPFTGRTNPELTASILTAPPPAIPARVPPRLAAIILNCLEKDVGQRYQTTAEVRAALEAVGEGRAPWKSAWRVAIAAGAVALLLVAGMFLPRFTAPRVPDIRRVAVVPDVARTLPEDLEAQVDGLVDSVINSLALAQQSRLRVIALSSVGRYRGTPVDIAQIGRDLSVDDVAILKVTKTANFLVVSAELVNLNDRTRLWGNRFDTATSTMLSVQDDIAASIAEALGLPLSGQQRQSLSRGATSDPAAYDAYLRGRYYWYLGGATDEDYGKSLDYFQRAIDRDPQYALAHLGKADTYLSMAIEGWVRPSEALAQAHAAFSRATALEPSMPEAHYTRGTLAWMESQWQEAAEESRTATLLNPTSPQYHRYYGLLLLAFGRFDAALAELQRALSVDPLGLETNIAVGTAYFWTGDQDRAIAQYRNALMLASKPGPVYELLQAVYAQRGDWEESFKALVKSVELTEGTASAEALQEQGRQKGPQKAAREYFDRELAISRAASEVQYVSPMELGLKSIQAGVPDEAFTWFQKAYEEHSPWLVYLRVDPAFDPLRSDPRFEALVREVNAPWFR